MDSILRSLSQNGSNDPVTERREEPISRDEALKRSRAALNAVSVELKELEVQFGARAAQIAGAQACLRLMVPADLLAQHRAVLVATPQAAVTGDLTPEAEAFLHDMKTSIALDETQVALVRLAMNNRRFGMVVDLMSAAAHLLEASTELMAQNFLHLHIKQCRGMLAQVDETLRDFPRLHAKLLKSCRGPEA